MSSYIKIITFLKLRFYFNCPAFSVLPSVMAQSWRHEVKVLTQLCLNNSGYLFSLNVVDICTDAWLCRVYSEKCLTPISVWKAFSGCSVSALYAFSFLFGLALTCKGDQMPNLWSPVNSANVKFLVQKLLRISRWGQQHIKPSTEPFREWGHVWLHRSHTLEVSSACKGKWKYLSVVTAFGRNSTASKLNTDYWAEVIDWTMLPVSPYCTSPLAALPSGYCSLTVSSAFVHRLLRD